MDRRPQKCRHHAVEEQPVQYRPERPEMGEVVRNAAVGDEVVLAGGVDVEHRFHLPRRDARDDLLLGVRLHDDVADTQVTKLLPALAGQKAVVTCCTEHAARLELDFQYQAEAANSLSRDDPRYQLTVVVREDGLPLGEVSDTNLPVRCFHQG